MKDRIKKYSTSEAELHNFEILNFSWSKNLLQKFKTSQIPDPKACNGFRSKVFYTMVAIKANSNDAMGQLISDNLKRTNEDLISQRSPARASRHVASNKFVSNVDAVRNSPERFGSPSRRSGCKIDKKPMF